MLSQTWQQHEQERLVLLPAPASRQAGESERMAGHRAGRTRCCGGGRMLLLPLLLALMTIFPACLLSAKMSPLIEKISDQKDFKKLLRTRNNVLVLYSKSSAAADSSLRLLSDVAQAVKGRATVSWIDCGDAESRKLCKKMKVDPSSKEKGVELLHYKDGTFHTEYNRALTLKSVVAFLKDPEGAPLWEEDPEAKDIVHIDSEKELRRLLKKEDRPVLLMFYAPWCGVCKRMMPSFQQASTELKGMYVLAGMNVYSGEFEKIKEEYNVRGYPTICYFEKGKFLFNFENYSATAKDIAEWLQNPQPPKPQTPEIPWSEEDNAVYHLTDDDFDKFIKEHPSVLVMFYAPWCGHCKKMKPEYEKAAETLHSDTERPCALAAVDATINKAVAERFHISGFPTLKYFQDGEEKYTLPHLRTKSKIIEWLMKSNSLSSEIFSFLLRSASGRSTPHHHFFSSKYFLLFMATLNPFKHCVGCDNNSHAKCLFCLGEAHQMSSLQNCKNVKCGVLRSRLSTLKLHLWEQSLQPTKMAQPPCKATSQTKAMEKALSEASK
ncbi:protein disulfide-isomerase A5 isoform X1 [Pogona vitticeps]